MVLERQEAYIGVMIDDIVHRGVDEPYRLFTARAEYRLQLREDNVFERLGAVGLRLGLVEPADYDRQMRQLEKRRRVIRKLAANRARCGGKTETLLQILKRPEMTLAGLQDLHGRELMKKMTFSDASYIEAHVKYEGYVAIQHKEVAKMRKLQKSAIPEDLDFQHVAGLSTEIREKLAAARPRTLAEVARIPGVTPAAVNAVSIHLTLNYGKPPA